MIIEFPHKFDLREYQKEVWDDFFAEKHARYVNVWHRRAGKDSFWLQAINAYSQKRVGTYLYTLPELKQARNVIWEGINKEGVAFLDLIPKELIAKKKDQDMSIQYKNGSVLKFGGTDRFNSLMGMNIVGLVQSEFSLQNPLAWEYLSPIIRENDGWAAFIYTPRGNNHGHKLFKNAKNNDDWFCSLKTVDDTKRNDGTPVFSKEDVQAEIDAGIDRDVIQQEYYCSWTAAVPGAYFSVELMKMEKDGRIKDFAIDPDYPVITSWDLGWDDATSIWFFQVVNNVWHAIAYYENNKKDISHYVQFVNDFRLKFNINYSYHLLPHDGAKHELGDGLSVIEKYRMKLGDVRLVKRCKSKINPIQQARSLLNMIIINKTNCEFGLGSLREYHSEYKQKMMIFGSTPVHNWAAHGADAFMTLAQYLSSEKVINRTNYTICNAVESFNF